jgi:hypothetical protein
MDFGRFFFYRQLWKKLGFWSVYKNPKTKNPKKLKPEKPKSTHRVLHPPSSKMASVAGWTWVGSAWAWVQA